MRKQRTPQRELILGIRAGRDDVVKRALERGADPNDIEAGQSLLEHACWRGRVTAARLLLEHGAEPKPSRRGFNPVFIALLGANGELLQLLLEYGAPIDLHTLRYGLEHDAPQVTEYLESFTGPMFTPRKQGMDISEALCGDRYKTAAWLISRGDRPEPGAWCWYWKPAAEFLKAQGLTPDPDIRWSELHYTPRPLDPRHELWPIHQLFKQLPEGAYRPATEDELASLLALGIPSEVIEFFAHFARGDHHGDMYFSVKDIVFGNVWGPEHQQVRQWGLVVIGGGGGNAPWTLISPDQPNQMPRISAIDLDHWELARLGRDKARQKCLESSGDLMDFLRSCVENYLRHSMDS